MMSLEAGESTKKSGIQWNSLDSMDSMKLVEVGNLANGSIGVSQKGSSWGNILVN